MATVDESRPRRSSEFWAIIGSAVAIGALMLTVSGWHRSDIESLRAEIGGVRAEIGGVRGEIGGVRGEIGGLRAEMRTEIGDVRAEMRAEIGGVRGEIGGLRGEVRALDERLSGRIDKLQEGQAQMVARLAVLESHVLGTAPVAQWGSAAESAP